MSVAAYSILWLTCYSFILAVFSFWLGRCARKLPMIDNQLPWTIHRDPPLSCGASNKTPHIPSPQDPCWSNDYPWCCNQYGILP